MVSHGAPLVTDAVHAQAGAEAVTRDLTGARAGTDRLAGWGNREGARWQCGRLRNRELLARRP